MTEDQIEALQEYIDCAVEEKIAIRLDEDSGHESQCRKAAWTRLVKVLK